MFKIVIFVELKPNRNGQIHVLGTQETLPKYMSQARDANLRHSDWFKSAPHKIAGKQLSDTRCSDFDKSCLYHLLIHLHVIRLSKLYWALTLLLLEPFSYKLMHHLKPFAIVVLNGRSANTKPCLDLSKW